jgi:hypothetical protein
MRLEQEGGVKTPHGDPIFEMLFYLCIARDAPWFVTAVPEHRFCAATCNDFRKNFRRIAFI